jgi:predicted 3-demethylubiquinone-9 3-methyltransferase (glyoxalase superfamily)
MTSGPIVPCLWLDHQAEEAAKSYTETFPDGRITVVSHHPPLGARSRSTRRVSLLR